ncbi:hypothetical protein FS749_015692 [Ceratobasidium sp. UAMH 11750]|nr:hypothetical protein FS749_015692 [Ceratobasidium sp. UAMH 11750]
MDDARAADLNAAGLTYGVPTVFDSSSVSHSASLRPRALTGSSNDNPRAPKRRANLPVDRESPGTPSELATINISDDRRAGLGGETGGRIALPPLHFPPAPTNSSFIPNSSDSYLTLPPLRTLHHSSTVLRPIQPSPRSPAALFDTSAGALYSAPQTSLHSRARYAAAGGIASGFDLTCILPWTLSWKSSRGGSLVPAQPRLPTSPNPPASLPISAAPRTPVSTRAPSGTHASMYANAPSHHEADPRVLGPHAASSQFIASLRAHSFGLNCAAPGDSPRVHTSSHTSSPSRLVTMPTPQKGPSQSARLEQATSSRSHPTTRPPTRVMDGADRHV